MPFGPFLSQQQKNEINNAMYKNAPAKSGPRTQAQKTQQIDGAVSNWVKGMTTQRGTPVAGPGGGNGFGLGSNNGQTSPTVAPAPVAQLPAIPPRVNSERKPGPWDEGYERPSASSFMDPVAPPKSNPAKLATTPERPIYPSEVTATNANGVDQTMKNLGGGVPVAFVPEYANSSFNDLLAAQGNAPYRPFGGSQLTSSGGNPFEMVAPKTQPFGAPAPGITGASYDNYGTVAGTNAAGSADQSQFTPMSGAEQRIEGGSDRKKGGSLADALADTAGINSYMSKFSDGDRERAAGMAFLNADGALEGLQARDAVNDVVYAGGQHYGRGALSEDAGIGDKYKIDRADARDIASGKQSAAGLLESYKTRITESQKQTPSQAQDPLTGAAGAVKSAFAAGAQTDFALNNDNTAPSPGVGPVVPPDIIENYDFTKPGAKDAYFRPGGILDQHTKRK